MSRRVRKIHASENRTRHIRRIVLAAMVMAILAVAVITMVMPKRHAHLQPDVPHKDPIQKPLLSTLNSAALVKQANSSAAASRQAATQRDWTKARSVVQEIMPNLQAAIIREVMPAERARLTAVLLELKALEVAVDAGEAEDILNKLPSLRNDAERDAAQKAGLGLLAQARATAGEMEFLGGKLIPGLVAAIDRVESKLKAGVASAPTVQTVSRHAALIKAANDSVAAARKKGGEKKWAEAHSIAEDMTGLLKVALREQNSPEEKTRLQQVLWGERWLEASLLGGEVEDLLQKCPAEPEDARRKVLKKCAPLRERVHTISAQAKVLVLELGAAKPLNLEGIRKNMLSRAADWSSLTAKLITHLGNAKDANAQKDWADAVRGQVAMLTSLTESLRDPSAKLDPKSDVLTEYVSKTATVLRDESLRIYGERHKGRKPQNDGTVREQFLSLEGPNRRRALTSALTMVEVAREVAAKIQAEDPPFVLDLYRLEASLHLSFAADDVMLYVKTAKAALVKLDALLAEAGDLADDALKAEYIWLDDQVKLYVQHAKTARTKFVDVLKQIEANPASDPNGFTKKESSRALRVVQENLKDPA